MASAAALAVKGDIKAAKDILQKALNTLVITQTIIPLPISNAQALLLEAEQIVNKTDRNPSDNKHLENILKETRTELKFAEVLGYDTKNDFKQLYKELDSIEVKAEGGKSGKDFFLLIDELMKNLYLTLKDFQMMIVQPYTELQGCQSLGMGPIFLVKPLPI